MGWGFKLEEDDLFLYGSTDHLTRHDFLDIPAWIDYMSVPAGEENDWWCEEGDRKKMIASMTRSGDHIWYHACKILPVAKPDFDQAKKLAYDLKVQGWSVFSNNCVQQTYELAKTYGVGSEILNPWQNTWFLIPRNWYKMIRAEEMILNKAKRDEQPFWSKLWPGHLFTNNSSLHEGRHT